VQIAKFDIVCAGQGRAVLWALPAPLSAPGGTVPVLRGADNGTAAQSKSAQGRTRCMCP
jgi:hypothetical protein